MIVRELINKIGFKTDEASLRRVEQRMRAVSRNMENIGRKMSLRVTLPILAFGAASVRAFSIQNQALAQLRTGLETTGGTVGKTFDELRKGAQRLQRETLFGDETILQNVTNQLLTFTGIVGDNFDKTQQAVVDVTARINGTSAGAEALRATAIQLGKALNDPVANLGALSRSGIQFSKQQKEVIKRLSETGRLADAQALILEELQKQYGGSAKAARDASSGFKIMTDKLGDLMERIGEIINKFMKPLFLWLGRVFEKMGKLDDKVIIVGVAFAALLAVVGPLLIGLAALLKLFIFITIPVLILAAKIILIAAAIALVAAAIGLFIEDLVVWVRGGDSLIGDFLGSWTDFKAKMISIITSVRNKIVEIFTGLWTELKFLVRLMLTTLSGLVPDSIKEAWSDLVEWFSDLFSRIASAFKEKLGIIFDVTGRLIDKVKGLFGKAVTKITPIIEPLVSVAKDVGRGAKGVARSVFEGEGFIPQGLENRLAIAASGIGPIRIPTSGTSNQVNIRSDVKIEIPAGTTDQQKAFIENDVRRVVSEENDKMARAVEVNNQEIEE